MTHERAATSAEVDRYERITTLLRAASAARHAGEFASFALAQATAAVGAPAGLVVSVRGDLAHVVASQGMNARLLAQFPARVGANLPVTEAIARNQPMWIEDRARVAARESDWARSAPDAIGIVPMAVAGRCIGAIAVAFYEPTALDEQRRALLALMAEAVAPALDRLEAPSSGSVETPARDTSRPEMLPAFLRAVSEGLGGDTVSYVEVDPSTRSAAVTAAHDPNSNAAADLAPMVGASSPIAGTVIGRVAETRNPVFAPATSPDDASVPLPEPWRSHVAQFPVHGLIAVPVLAGDDVRGVLVTARRRPDLPYTPGDLEYAITSAQRLSGLLQQWAMGDPERTDPDLVPSGTGSELLAVSTRELSWPLALLVGLIAQLVLSAVLLQFDDPNAVRPGAVLMAVMVVLAVKFGARAGVAAALSGLACLWGLFTEPAWSVEVAPHAAMWGVLAYGVTSVTVLVLVAHLDRARAVASSERSLTSTVLEEAPVGIALFDRELRFVRVNRRLAEINDREASRHIGRRPSEVSPLGGQLYEPLLERVRDSGTPIFGEQLSVVAPEVGVERHWRASYYPIRDLLQHVVGVGAVVEEVTGEVVAKNRVDRLLELAAALAGVSDLDGFADALNRFLASAFGARGAVALVMEDGGSLEIRATAGYDRSFAHEWDHHIVSRELDGTLPEAVRTGRIVEIADPETYDERYPSTAAARARSGDRAVVAVPLRDPLRDEAVGAFQVAWPYPRHVTDHSRTLLRTTASMAELALSRIRIAMAVQQDRFRRALDAMLDTVVIARAVRDESGEIVDFVFEYASAATRDGAGRGADELVGKRLLDVYPRWREAGMLAEYARVVETGEPFVAERLQYSDENGVSGHWNLQVARFGDDGVIVSSRDVTDIVKAEAVERERAQLEYRQRVAVDLLQRAALPVEVPEVERLRIGAHHQPASSQAVGGDWYDAFALEDGVALVIADVAGHGPESAAFMVQVRNILRAVAVEHRRADEVLRRVNDVVNRLREADGLFVTCCYATLDSTRGVLTFASAGHPPPLVVSAGSSTYPAVVPGPPLAAVPGAGYPITSIPVHPGDRIFLFTDGLVERRNESLDVGMARLAESAAALRDVDVQDAVERLGAQVTAQFDDLAILCAEIEKADPAR